MLTLLQVPLMRYVSLLALGLLTTAIALNRWHQSPWRDSAALRLPGSTRFLVVPSYFHPEDPDDVELLDLDTEQLRSLTLPDGLRLDRASAAPWRDTEGGTQILGAWSLAPGTENRGRYGVLRMRWPDAEVLDRIETEVPPQSPPCWAPGTHAEALFSGADGVLYRVAFESPVANALPGPRVAPLAWNVERPRPGPYRLNDPSWTSAGQGRMVLVAATRLAPLDSRKGYRLWWLRLDATASVVEEAGPLLLPELDDLTEQRHPLLFNRPDGTSMLLWLSRRLDSDVLTWTLNMAPVQFDPKTQSPSADPRAAEVLANDCLCWGPVLGTPSTLYVLRHTGLAGTKNRIPRFSFKRLNLDPRLEGRVACSRRDSSSHPQSPGSVWFGSAGFAFEPVP